MNEEKFEDYRQEIRAFSQDVLKPAESLTEKNDEIPPNIVNQMRRIGLFGISLPEEFAGREKKTGQHVSRQLLAGVAVATHP